MVEGVRFERHVAEGSPGLHDLRASYENDGMPTNCEVDGEYLGTAFPGHNRYPAVLHPFQQFQALLFVDRLECSVSHHSLLWDGPARPIRGALRRSRSHDHT